MAPTILLVPGIWVGPTAYAEVEKQLQAASLKVEAASLVSTGTTSPGNPGLLDDIAAVRKHISSILARGEDTVLVLHSAGGFIGGAAAEGLSKKAKNSEPGVTHAVFLSGAVVPAGYEHKPLPFAYVDGGASLCKEPENLLFNDLPEAEQKKWIALLKPQPAQGWDDIIPHAPWAEIPSTYVICEKDNLLPPPLQEQFAATAGSRLERIPAGHMPMLSAPSEVTRIIRTAASA